MAIMRRRRQPALQQLQDDSAYSKRTVEVLDYTYYDRMALLSTVTKTRMFTVQLGQQGKSLADTNMLNSSLLPQGQNLKVYFIKIGFHCVAVRTETELQSIYDFIRETTLTFKIPGKDNLGIWPLHELMGIATLIDLVPSVAGDNIPLIQPSYKSVYPLNFQIKLGAIQTFEVEVEQHTASAADLDGDFLWVGLNGRLRRMS